MMRITSPRIARHFALVLRAILIISLLISQDALFVLPGAANSQTDQTDAADMSQGKVRSEILPRTKGTPGPDLPDLSALRNSPIVQPQAPLSVAAKRSCLDCAPRAILDDDFSVARTKPGNCKGGRGVDFLSQNYHWSLPLVSLTGRAGLDLNLSLSYNSLVWTKSGTTISFDADRGQPSPGFQLGLPTIQSRYYNSLAGSYSYLMTTSDGASVELRQVGSTRVYEGVDGSNWRMKDNGSRGVVMRTSAGAQLTFVWLSGHLQCTEVKDRNGNYLTISYDGLGHLNRITDTLGRNFKFNRDSGGNVVSITQTRESGEYAWATFGYSDLTINTNFSGLQIVGAAKGRVIPVLTQVGLKDGSRYGFDYTSWGQIWRITRYAADGHALSSTSYDLPLTDAIALNDCPRVTEQSLWAENWNDDKPVLTSYRVASNGEWSETTLPNGTLLKRFYATDGWRKGLPTRTETWAGGVLQKWTTTSWTQDDPSRNVPLNPRVEEINIYDLEGNRRRMRVECAAYGLPKDVYEYAANGETPLRRTHTDYDFDPTYISRNVIGLVSARLMYDGENKLLSKTTYQHDENNLLDQSAANQHDDTQFGVNLLKGRGLECEVRQWDANDPDNKAKSKASQAGYRTTGTLAFMRDARNRQSAIDYSDNFSDGKERNAFAYATTTTDPDGNRSIMQYDYATAAVLRTQDKSGHIHTQEYDAAGRTLQSFDQSTGATTRSFYAESGALTATFSKVETNAEEVESYTVFDGAARVRATATDLPSSRGGYSGSYTVYDAMGQVVQWTNTTEMTGSWRPAGDDIAGWVWSAQEYDWKGRPTVTINADGTTRQAKYGGCGCAGGEVLTLTDESGRSRKESKDSLGRLVKVEELNWDGSVYATTEYAYNALDQMTSSNQSGQVREWEYDGFGRTSAEVTPEQGRTEYEYNGDGSLKMITDARGAGSNFKYDARANLLSIAYNAPKDLASTPPTTFGYDSEGRREWMQDGAGRVAYRYDERGRLKEEQRRFNDLPDSAYTLSYEYGVASGLQKVSASWGEMVGYKHDRKGRLAEVTDGETSLISDIEYRAWGAIKNLSYGNGRKLAMDYDERLRLTRRDIEGVQGAEYKYDDFGENTGRVTRVRDLYARTLDRFYEYDQVGRLQAASDQGTRNQVNETGVATRDTMSVPNAQQYRYDVWGNLVDKTSQDEQSFHASYNNNQLERDPLTGKEIKYDRAGNLTDDGQQEFTYDAAGHQRSARSQALEIKQDYDGNGLRVKKIEAGSATYYVRSTVLGNQVVADLDVSGRVIRSYIYAGQKLLAIKNQTGMAWVHSDPITKSQRLTDRNGSVISGVELDPWGKESARSFETTQGNGHSRRFTSYERDANGSDDAMHRRYNSMRGRFDQPDPYRGSYNPSNPQSLNRYSYTENDPVNHTDPSGLNMANDFDAWYGGCSLRGYDQYETRWFFCWSDGYNSGGGGDYYSEYDLGVGSGGATERTDLPEYVRRVYIDLGQKLTDCLNSVFSKVITGRNGVTTAGSNLFPYQQMRNAPYVDETQSVAQLAGYGLSQASDVNLGPNGTVHIGGDIADFSSSQGTIGAFEIKERTYVHELGNILSRRISPDSSGTTFGDSNGITSRFGSEPDYDTGAALEKCVFGDVAP